jgi:hypothetical protein
MGVSELFLHSAAKKARRRQWDPPKVSRQAVSVAATLSDVQIPETCSKDQDRSLSRKTLRQTCLCPICIAAFTGMVDPGFNFLSVHGWEVGGEQGVPDDTADINSDHGANIPSPPSPTPAELVAVSALQSLAYQVPNPGPVSIASKGDSMLEIEALLNS